MSSNSVKKWKDYTEKIKDKQLWPRGTPLITCVEDLTMAAKAVQRSFRAVAKGYVKRSKCDARPLDDFFLHKYGNLAWFRGNPVWLPKWSLTAAVYREDLFLRGVEGKRSPEKWMLTEFYRKAVLRDPSCPPPGEAAAWLALAQHHLLPTRLLDWSESVLVAGWFATYLDEKSQREKDLLDLWTQVESKVSAKTAKAMLGCMPEWAKSRIEAGEHAQTVVWALSPSLLNYYVKKDGPVFALKATDSIVRGAFSGEPGSEDAVLAVQLQDVHPRMMMQHAAFTVHSTEECLASLNERACEDRRFLRRLVIDPKSVQDIRRDLGAVWVSLATIFPDLQHLATDIQSRWKDIVNAVKSGG